MRPQSDLAMTGILALIVIILLLTMLLSHAVFGPALPR